MTKEEQFVNELIGYIFAYPDDDYMTMECLCRKLFKYGLIEKKDGEWTTDFILVPVLRKDEPTISKMEQVDKDINVRSKDEPQTCDTCKHNCTKHTYDHSCEVCADMDNYEPQTERSE